MRFEFYFTKKQTEFEDAINRYPVVLFGGSRGIGKSFSIRNLCLKRRLEQPGTVGAIFRRTYPELLANHIQPLLAEHSGLGEYFNQSRKSIELPNGSKLRFCYCNSERDVDSYRGQEFDDLAIEEAGDWTEIMFHRLRGSNRSSRKGIEPKCYLAANPGGVGHGWLKRLFVVGDYRDNEDSADYYLVSATMEDNPALQDNDPDYVKRLQAEPSETLRRAYLHGDWDIQAGQFFNELRRDIHMVKAFEVPDHWVRFGSYDYGYNHPAAFHWFAVDEDGFVYVVNEYISAGRRIDEQARDIKQFKDTNELRYVVGGHDCWARRANERGRTIAEEFADHGLILRKANNDRIQGAAQVRQYLAHQNLPPGTRGPRLILFDTCPITFDCLSRMQHNINSVEDVLKVDAVEGDPWTGDDAYDSIRHGLMSRPVLTPKKIPKYKQRYGDRYKKSRVDNWKVI